MSETPTCYRLIKRKARKEHRCCECRGVITVGETYNHHSGVWGGEPAAYKVCSDCDELRSSFVIDTGCYYDELPAFACLGDDLEDWHLEQFRNIQRKRNSNSRSYLAWLEYQKKVCALKGGAA